MISFMISFWAAVAIALPVILWQLWSFLAPAFHEHTQRVVLGFVLFATVLFVSGLIFAYFVALPASIQFLTNFDSDQFDIQLRAQRLLHVRAAGADRALRRLPAADLHPRARPARHRPVEQAAA